MRLLSHLLRRFVRNGRLAVIDHAGARHEFGTGASGPDVTIRLHDAAVEREIFFNAELKAAEAYMDGRLTIEDGGMVHDLLLLFSVNRKSLAAHPMQRLLERTWRALRRLQQRNAPAAAATNVRGHYDHPAEFYALWLDPGMSYSCAYFARPGLSLAEAQTAKCRHIAAKLKLAPGQRVLDIGCGWGGLAIQLARECGVEVTGISLSPPQVAEARRRAVAAGVADRVRFLEADYREVSERYDRVVSVGMMEHVGVPYFGTYFRAIRDLLAPGGFALVHAIGKVSPPSTTSPFIRKHIFPGGYSPALSEVFSATERERLWVCDCEVLRLHYHWTLEAWRLAFAERRPEVVTMMGERFTRMWEFYLSAASLGFLHGSSLVFQLLLAETRDAVPVTRDYIAAEERRLHGRAEVEA